MADETANKLSPICFCPRCHRPNRLPFQGNVNFKGTLKIKCGYCKKGQIVIKPKTNDNGK